MKGKWQQGEYYPKNTEKYIGNAQAIVYRSSYELLAFKWVDMNPDILYWCSEEVIIPYLSPLDNRIHKYYMDLLIKYKDKHGQIKNALIEIKPSDQTVPPKPPKKRTSKSYKTKVKAFIINQAKWQAAEQFAKKHDMKFIIMTEKHLNALR